MSVAEIRIVEKPDDISYDDIHDLLYSAHAENRARGLTVKTSLLSGEELRRSVGEAGRCFVALDGDRPVGTTSVAFKHRNRWYAHGKVAYKSMIGVLPSHAGRHLSDAFEPFVEDFARASGCDCIELHTAQRNAKMQRAARRQGYRRVDFISVAGEDHYTVVMMKWLGGAPCSPLQAELRYRFSRLRTRLQYRPDHAKRFGR